MRKELTQKFIERALQLQMKGKKRDATALEFILGAATMGALCNPPIDLTEFAWVVSIRGYSAIEEAVKETVAA